MQSKQSNVFVALLTGAFLLIGCAGDDSDSAGGATIKLVNGESGCTLSEVYIAPAGEGQGANLVAGNGIRYNSTPRPFSVSPGETYSLSVSSNTTTSNLSPVAKCSVTLSIGETRVITYSYAGGPSLYYGTLSGCD